MFRAKSILTISQLAISHCPELADSFRRNRGPASFRAKPTDISLSGSATAP